MKALRSRLSAIARCKSRSSTGDLLRLISRSVLIFCGTSSQIACGVCALMSFINGGVTAYGWIMSICPVTSAKVRVDGFLMIGYSIPSR